MLNYEINKIDNDIINDCYYIINRYLNKNKKIDIFFLEEVVEVVKCKKKLDEYIKKVGYDNTLKKYGLYDNIDKSILINYDRFSKNTQYEQIFFNKNNFDIYVFIRMISLILHEIEHANQEEIIKNDNSLESLILSATTNSILLEDYSKKENLLNQIVLDYKIKRHNRIYKRYYEFAPEERLAYIKSSSLSLKLAELFEIDKINNLMECFLYYEYIKGYIKKLNPTKFYIKKLYPNSEGWDKIENKSMGLELNERLLFGLKITKDELEQIFDEIREPVNKCKEENNILTKKRK